MTTHTPTAIRATRLTAATAACIAVLGAALAAFAAPSFAAEAAAPVKGSPEAGAAKAATCLACHGANGNSVNPEWPVIAGQNANYVAEQITLIRDGKRPNVLMQPMVKDLGNQDIADLAAYFATQTPVGHEADAATWQAGEKLYRGGDSARGIPACMACHGPIGRGNPAAGYPALRAQYGVYTVKQLTDYSSEARYTKDAKGHLQAGPNAQIMLTVAARLSANDRRNLASYIQGMR
jgi:cytochrome c553